MPVCVPVTELRPKYIHVGIAISLGRRVVYLNVSDVSIYRIEPATTVETGFTNIDGVPLEFTNDKEMSSDDLKKVEISV
jgi:hypothetical protein